MNPQIAIFAASADSTEKALQLANSLKLPVVSEPSSEYPYLLVVTSSYLGLKKNDTNSQPLIIDFLSKQLQYRRKQASLRNELLARALGLKTKAPRCIVDATTGLGRDSFILSSLGFDVYSLERSPIIFTLIEDAKKRASHDIHVKPVMDRMHLIQTDAVTWLKNQKEIDIIYLDPMFPESKKSALSKLDMRIFHDVVGDDTDANELLHVALSCAKQRVVVKRPRLAAPLAGLSPSLSMEGSSNRFDIYLIQENYGNTSSVT